MKLLHKLDENGVISLFLLSEFKSSRFGSDLLRVLKTLGFSKDIILKPDLENTAENACRRDIIGEYRGYGRNTGLFTNFPKNVEWYEAFITRKELSKVRYINWYYWLGITGGSRLPCDVRLNVSNDVISSADIKLFYAVLADIEASGFFPKLIFVTTGSPKDLVVLEGHLRVTASFLKPKIIPNKVNAIVGISKEFTLWGFY